MQAIGCQDVVLFALPNAFITNKQHVKAKQRCRDVLFALPNAFITNKQHVKAKQRCKDGVMSDFVSWCRHLLVPFFFMRMCAEG